MRNLKNQILRPVLILKKVKEIQQENSELTTQEAGQLAIEQLTEEGTIICIKENNEQN